jgi:uncharacterized protein DUF5076
VPKELPLPAAVITDGESVELLRLWAAGGKQHVSLNPTAWTDPAAWGICLVDLARHVANAYAQARGGDPGVILRRLREAFDAEWTSPTDTPTGGSVS